MRKHFHFLCPVFHAGLVLAFVTTVRALDISGSAPTNAAIASYKKMSLDELLNQEVTTVSRTPEKLLRSASAVQVVTSDDIHRAGPQSLPEALRLAYNLDVAQAASSSWSVSARGFNASVGNKLLVLMDGRTIYTPLFS